MADEAHTPNHRWYQRQYNVSLAPNMVSRDIILAAGIALIDAASITPANLFAAGEPGVWYDPSDLNTLFQDSAGTTPVTAAGQPVGRILDKSGRGNHATQAVAGQRPTYQIDGTGRPYLSFDGVDDFLVTPALTLIASNNKVQIFAGVRKATDLVTGIIAEMSSNSATSNYCFAIWGNTGTGYTFRSKGSLSTSTSGGSTAAPVLDVLTAIGDIGAPLAKLRLDGADVSQSTATQGTLGYGDWPIYIGNRSDGTLPFNGRLYGLVTRFGANLDAEMISRMEAWMNGKTGAY